MPLSSPRTSEIQATLVPPLYWPEPKKQLYLIAQAVQNILDGKINSTGSFTLTANQTTTVVQDRRVGTKSVIVWHPTTQNAGGEVGMYLTNVGELSGGVRSFTINHGSDSRVDRVFRYCVLG